MKKILRLVTTSVLTLTLVACGEASSSVSSSVSSSTPASSSVSSVSSAFANVTSVTLSAASDVLTQTLGAQRAVVVQAALNANTNPNVSLEWFVNGTKSNQTGRVFEYTPAAAGEFVIQARVGTVVSNNLTLTVGAPVFAITGDVNVISNSRIEVTASGGATVTVTNNTIKPSSFYDLAKGIYVIDLVTPLAQGATATVTLARDGSSANRSFKFDTRTLEVAAVSGTGVTDNKDGTYSISRPHALSGATGAVNTTTNPYLVTFKSSNFTGTAVAFKLESVSVPTGATAMSTTEGLVAVTGTDAGGRTVAFNVTRQTVPGDYVYRYTLGELSRTFTIKVVVPQQELTVSDLTVGGTKVDPKADGTFELTKDYLTGTTVFKTFTFTVNAKNFLVPENLLTSTVEPNQLAVSVTGPDGLGVVRVQAGVTANSVPLPASFRADTNTAAENKPLVLTQRFDSATTAGTYTYSIVVRQLGVEIATKQVVVNIVNPVASLELGTAAQLTTNNVIGSQWYNTATNNLITATAAGTWAGATSVNFVEYVAQTVAGSYRGLVSVKPSTIAHPSFFFATDEDKLYSTTAANTWNSGVVVSTTPYVDQSIFKFTKSGDKLTVQKPLPGADSQFIFLPFVVKNFDSPRSLTAPLADAFTGADTFRKQLLTYKKSYTGPMTLDSSFTLDSKLALELGASAAGVSTVANLAATPASFPLVKSTTDSVVLADQFLFEVNSLTASGNYTFTLQVGDLIRTITVEVLQPAREIDFSIKTNAVSANGSIVSLGADGKYHTTLGFGNSKNQTVVFNLLLRNFGAAGNLPYTIERVLPSSSDVLSNTVATTAALGNDGNLVSEADTNLLLLTVGGTKANGTLGTPATTASVVFDTAGEYKYTITAGGVSKQVTLVVNPYPGVKVLSTNAPTSFDGVDMIKASASTTTVKLSVEASNLPANVFYKVIGKSTFYSGIEIAAGVKTETIASADTQLTALAFTAGLANVDVVVPATPTSTMLEYVVALYTRAASGSNFVYTLIGHTDYKVWNATLP